MTETRGRKKRPVGIHTYRFPLEPQLVSAVESLIAAVDDRPPGERMAVTRWCTLAIEQAYGYDGLRLPADLIAPVPIVPELAELRAFASSLDKNMISAVTRSEWQMYTIRLDRPLADVINPRMTALGMSYTAYLREVIRFAAGCYHAPRRTQLSIQLTDAT